MKTIYIIISLLSCSIFSLQAQSVTCSELLKFVQENGYKTGEVGAYQLYDSSWLKSVKAYQYKNSIFVIAEIKNNQYSYRTNTYIFCGIPVSNWDNFQSHFYDSDLTYGEKFHKYIMDYKCSCN